MMLRADLYSLIDEIASLLMSIELCPIVSFNDDLWVSNYALKNGGSILVKRVQAMVWDKEYFEKHTPGRMVASRLWFDTEKVAPLLALRWRVTTMVYAKYFPSNNDCTSIAWAEVC